MTNKVRTKILGEYGPKFEASGYPCIALAERSKSPLDKHWPKALQMSQAERLRSFKGRDFSNIGLLAGSLLSTGLKLGFLDVDYERLVRFVQHALESLAPAKVGSKGATFFFAFEPGHIKSRKFRAKGVPAPVVELFASSGQTVVPPSIHPNGNLYRWVTKSLLEIKHNDLPVLSIEWAKIIETVVTNKNALAIAEGGAEGKYHDYMLALTGSGIANLTPDLDRLADCLNQLLPEGYKGNTASETLGMLVSAKEKGLGKNERRLYDARNVGPLPLGYTRDGVFALLDQSRQIIIQASAQQLLSVQFLLGLSPTTFWAAQFPNDKGGINAHAAGEALIAACKRAGTFNPQKVRGRGIWRENDRVVVNLGNETPRSRYLYLCFEPISLDAAAPFDTLRLLTYLKRFKWRNLQDAILLLGWLAIAPICGALNWRPHCFLYGPPRCGKTTIHSLAATLLHPLVISTDGQSTEAGIRQTLGPDSLPIIIDEFESDQRGSGLRAVLRLARSASSADNPVLRGTPEGKAMQFSLRTTFFFCAVNPGRMSPADQTRIIMLELLPHDNQTQTAKTLIEEEKYFRSLGQSWCNQMIALAPLINGAIDSFELVVPSSDRRHRQNFATLFAGAFVALKGRLPSEEEAQQWATEYCDTVERHSEEIDRDNAQECLDHLLAHDVDGFPLSHWIAVALEDTGRGDLYLSSQRVMGLYDIVAHNGASTEPGVLIRNGAPQIERLFQNTVWEGRGWEKALRGLDGAFSLKNPIYFSGSREKSRCIGIPLRYIPDPIETIDDRDSDDDDRRRKY